MTIRKITDVNEFSSFIRAQESMVNAGATCRYYPRRDVTEWHTAGRLVAVSLGNIGDERHTYFIDDKND